MSYKILLLRGAQSDIREAAEWYNSKQSGLGKKFITAIRDEISTIAKNPFLYAINSFDKDISLFNSF